MEEKEKIEYKLSSFYDVKLTADKMPLGPAYNFLGVGASLEKMMQSLSLDDDDVVFYDDIDWDSDNSKTVLEGFGTLMEHNFDIDAKSMKMNELHTAMNLPIIGAINAYVPALPSDALVCIIGADRGQNLSQCEHALNSKPLDWVVHCIEPSTDADVLFRLRKTLKPYPHARIFNQKLQDVDACGLVDDKGRPIQYDLIIHNLGMHVTCASEVDRDHYVNFINKHLKRGCRAICTTIDVDAIRRSDDLGMRSPSRTVELVQEYPPDKNHCEGSVYVRVGGNMFRDPILSAGRINAMFQIPGLHAQIVTGKYLFREHSKDYLTYVPHFRLPKSKHFENCARRIEMSIVTYVEIVKYDNLSDHCDYYEAGNKWSVEYGKWKQVDAFTDNEMSRCYFSMNHGRPLLATDLVYMSESDIMIAPKWNGTSGRMAIRRGIAHLYVDDKRLYRASQLDASFDHDMQLQVEVIDNVDGSIRVIVVDAYRVGKRSPTMFLDRWCLFESIYDRSTVLQSLVEKQRYSTRTIGEFVALISSIQDSPFIDGIVLQNKWAMPGCFKEALGSARYLKKRYTVDVLLGKEIGEYYLDTLIDTGELELVRIRKDKCKPNTNTQLMTLKAALYYEDWIDHIMLSRSKLTISDIPVTMSVLVGDASVDIIPLSEKFAIYRGRHDDYAVVKELLQDMRDKNTVFNYYLRVKNYVLRDMISRCQEELRLELVKFDTLHCDVVHGGVLSYIGTVSADRSIMDQDINDF